MSKKQLRNKLAGKLVEENALLCERIALLEKRGQFLSQENAFLRQKVDLLVRRVFGVSSEKLDPSQLDLLLLQAENTPGKPAASSPLEEAEPQPAVACEDQTWAGTLAARLAGGRTGDRSRGGSKPAARVALHWRGSQRATRL
ncbi:MAG: transposase [Verrucomicrobiota bacterium]